MSLKVLVVDDEPLACERLRGLLAELPGIEVVGEAHNGVQALELIPRLMPDVLLLDVRMPGIDGLQLARHLGALAAPPAVIFTTAYDEYAMQAFEAQAIGYLLKPVRAEKLAAALERARRLSARQLEQLREAPQQAGRRAHIAVRAREGLRLLRIEDVFYFAADRKYTTVRHSGGTDLIEEPLRALEQEFAPRFARIHRNALVNLDRVEVIERGADGQLNVRLRDLDEQLQVSRRLASELLEQFRARGESTAAGRASTA